MKIRQVEVELLHADGRTDGQTDMMTLIVAFRNFAKAPNTGNTYLVNLIVVQVVLVDEMTN
jgi:hypothetical protein